MRLIYIINIKNLNHTYYRIYNIDNSIKILNRLLKYNIIHSYQKNKKINKYKYKKI